MKQITTSVRSYLGAIMIGAMMLCPPALASNDAMACVKEIAIPSTYSTIQSRIPAIVEANILIGAGGRAERVTYDTDNKLLTLHLDTYFKEKTRYADSCKGRTVTFTVQYTLVDPEVDSSYSEVHFEPPDRFLVICHRLKPSFDPVRSKPLKK
jgi:hypothetical protein